MLWATDFYSTGSRIGGRNYFLRDSPPPCTSTQNIEKRATGLAQFGKACKTIPYASAYCASERHHSLAQLHQLALDAPYWSAAHSSKLRAPPFSRFCTICFQTNLMTRESS